MGVVEVQCCGCVGMFFVLLMVDDQVVSIVEVGYGESYGFFRVSVVGDCVLDDCEVDFCDELGFVGVVILEGVVEV